MGIGSVIGLVDALRDERRQVHPILVEMLTRSETKQVPGPNDWLGISRLPTWCPRAHVMAYRLGVKLVDDTTPKARWRMDRGKAMHVVMQELWLGPSGFLLGGWRCPACAHVHGAGADGRVTYSTSVAMPVACAKCKVERGRWLNFGFVEPEVSDPVLLVRGNMDGFLQLSPHPIEVMDIKTSDSLDKEYRRRDGTVVPSLRDAPKPDNVAQLQWYLELSGCQSGRLLYMNPGASDIEEAIVEHPVKYDPNYLHGEKEKVRVIRQALQDQARPVPECPTQGQGIYGDCACVELAIHWASRGRGHRT